MKFFTVKNLILFLILIIVIGRFSFFKDAAEFLVLYIRLLFYDLDFAVNQSEFQVIDTLFSVIFIPVLIVLIIAGIGKRWLNRRITFNSVVIIILTLFFFTAPAISSFHPEFHQNLSLTKFLKPFSRVLAVYESKHVNKHDLRDRFLQKKASAVKESINDNIRFTDNNPQIVNQENVNVAIFLLGTDQYGRDIFSRLVYGARISMFVGLAAVFISFLLGFIAGFAAGYSGGIVDIILNRTTDVFLSFPVIFLIILVLALFGNSLSAVIIVLGFTGWMSMFKIVRSEIIRIKKKEYFVSAALTGSSFFQLMFSEALPVIAVPVIVNLIFQFANVIIAEAALSYLGLGAGINYPSWGSMIYSAQGYLSEAWWMILPPGAILIFTLYTAYDTGKIYNRRILRKL